MYAMHLAPSSNGVFACGSNKNFSGKANASKASIVHSSNCTRQSFSARASQRTRRQSVVHASTTYEAPSSVGGASELEALSAITLVVPDSVLMASEKDIPRKAATVSAGVLGTALCRCIPSLCNSITSLRDSGNALHDRPRHGQIRSELDSILNFLLEV